MSDTIAPCGQALLALLESRHPSIAGHSNRVSRLALRLGQAVDAASEGSLGTPRIGPVRLEALRQAALLHDIGMLSVREKVVIKGKKLYIGELNTIETRFKLARRTLEVEHLRAQLDARRADPVGETAVAEADLARSIEELDRLFALARRANEPLPLDPDAARGLEELSRRRYADTDGSRRPLLTQTELAALTVTGGSLSRRERREIESHAEHTRRILSLLPWPETQRQVPEIAYACHERLDGSGYPRGLHAAEIPIEARILAIADTYDGLVAWDQPFRQAVPKLRALAIIKQETEGGRLDPELVRLFADSRIHEET